MTQRQELAGITVELLDSVSSVHVDHSTEAFHRLKNAATALKMWLIARHGEAEAHARIKSAIERLGATVGWVHVAAREASYLLAADGE